MKAFADNRVNSRNPAMGILSQARESHEGSVKVQRLGGEQVRNNPPTSARHPEAWGDDIVRPGMNTKCQKREIKRSRDNMCSIGTRSLTTSSHGWLTCPVELPLTWSSLTKCDRFGNSRTGLSGSRILPRMLGHTSESLWSKSGELRELCDENPEPSLANAIRVAKKVQRLGDEEATNNSPTSARHPVTLGDDIVWTGANEKCQKSGIKSPGDNTTTSVSLSPRCPPVRALGLVEPRQLLPRLPSCPGDSPGVSRLAVTLSASPSAVVLLRSTWSCAVERLRKHWVKSVNPEMGIPSQAARMVKSSAEGVETRDTRNLTSNCPHERPTPFSKKGDDIVRPHGNVNREKPGIKSPGDNTCTEVESFFVQIGFPEAAITPVVELYHQSHLRGILLKGITG